MLKPSEKKIKLCSSPALEINSKTFILFSGTKILYFLLISKSMRVMAWTLRGICI